MADEKVSALTALDPTTMHPFQDLLYWDLYSGGGRADRKATPFDMLVGNYRSMAWVASDFLESGNGIFGTFGNIGTANGDSTHQGVGAARASNAGAGDASGWWGTYQGVQADSGELRFIAMVFVDTLSDSTDRYIVVIGLPQFGPGDADPFDQSGFYVRYSDNINGGNWEFVTKNGGSSTNMDTGVTVAANTWYRIQIDAASDLSSISATIDAGSPVVSTTNLWASPVTMMAGIYKTLGTDQRTLGIDYMAYMKYLGAVR